MQSETLRSSRWEARWQEWKPMGRAEDRGRRSEGEADLLKGMVLRGYGKINGL